MKRITSIISILYLLSFVTAVAQEAISSSLILNANLPNTQAYNYKATQSIIFNPPFTFQAKGANSLRASIDPLNLTPDPFSDYINGGSNSRIVGKIGDQFEITPSGQASYEIPIKVPGGTGGMVPNLSIVYNSATKNGLLGYGFELAGLSIINRAPKNLHVDGNVTAVNFTTDDNIMLDGNRLIRVSPITVTSNIEYRTENNTFAKIISNTNPGSTNAKITVHTKDGLKYEYNSNHDLLTTRSASVENQDLFWTLTKVTDTKGNYFTISYNIDKENKEYTPQRIEYTGNEAAKLSPYCSIQFAYEEQPFPFTSFLSGMKIIKSKNLKAIEIYYGTTKIKSYELEYLNKNNTKLLSSVTEIASDSKKLNPTTFEWHTVDDLKIKKGAFNNDTSFDNVQVYPGDFNGDGKMDFITIPKYGANWTGIKVYLSEGSSFKYYGNFLSSYKNINSLAVGDFDGDGLSDIIVNSRQSDLYYYELYRFQFSSSGNITFNLEKHVRTPSLSNYEIISGDFNGDGASDIFLYAKDSYNYSIIQSETINNKISALSNPELGQSNTTRNPHKLNKVNAGDFNGDGLTDFIIFHDSGYDILEATAEGLILKQQNSRPIVTDYTFLGDFNGDGKTDMLFADLNANPRDGWDMYFSNGIKFNDPIKIPSFRSLKNQTLFVADINADGFDDFFMFYNETSDNANHPVYYYINNGDGISFTEYVGYYESPLINIDPYIADFNGDGRPDILTHYSKSKNKGYSLNLTPSGSNNLLSTITDGLGNTTSITYKPMSDKSVHEKGKTSNYPLNSFNSSWYLVDKVTQSNGIGGVFSQTYKYKNALLHKRGRGFLGFEYFITKDENSNTETTTQFEIDPTEYTTAIKSAEVRVNGKLINKSEYTNKLRYYENQVFTFGATSSREIQYEYNTGAQFSDITNRTVYDSFGNVTRSATVYSKTDSIVNVNIYKDDITKWYLGRLTESTVTKVSNAGTVTRTSKFGYDPNSGILNKEEVEPTNTQLGYTKTYVHDVYGNITSSTITPKDTKVPARTQSSVYDTNGRFEIKSINYLGHTTSRDVNFALGIVNYEIDPNGLKTEYIYDSFGQLIFSKTPLGNTQTVLRWSKGHPDAPSNSVYFSYSEASGIPAVLEFFDGLGRTLRKKVIGFDGKAIYSDVKYDTQGRAYTSSEPYFSGATTYWSINEFDAVGRVTKQIYPDETYHTYSYNGLTTTTTSPTGIVDIKILDLLGRLEKSIDNKKGEVSYVYDGAGNCKTVKGPRTTISAEFDIMGNRTKLVDPDLGTTEYKYNAYAELVYQKDANKNETTITYDSGGRTKTKVSKEGTTTYTYDTLIKGMLTSVTSPEYSQSFAYDSYGRITKLTEVIGNKTFSTYTTYDKFNRVDKITYPSSISSSGNFAVNHVYNSNGYLSEVKNAQSSQVYWKAKTMNARGQMEQFTLGNGLETTMQYNPEKGDIKNIKTPGKGSEKAIQDWTYTFNADGNLTSRKDNKRNMTESFEYDELNRLHLTFHQIGSGSKIEKEKVEYDGAGNLTYKTGIGTTFKYIDGTNRLQSVSGGNYNPPAWDIIEYTSFNKISKVVQAQGNYSLILTYGADQKRKKSVTTKNGKSDTRYYAGAIYEEDHLSTGEIKQRHYIFAYGGMIAIHEQSSTSGETLNYVHKDHLGSVQAYSDKNGKLVQELSYDAWGRRRSADEWKYYLNLPDANAWHERGFTGHEHLDLFEMINMDGRMYDPMLGRFLTPDPFVQAPDYTQGLNRYIYCLNNPLSLVDPSGYSWLSKNYKSLFAAGFGIFVATIPGGQGLGAIIIAGALGGAASGFAGAIFNGANIGQIAKSAIAGGFWGGIGAGVSNISGTIGNNVIKNMFAHSISQGFLEGIKGGNVKHGFISGLISSAGASGISAFGRNWSVVGKTAANAVIAGTAAELGGGKFANGAITGAYAMLFNHLMHESRERSTKIGLDQNVPKTAQRGAANCVVAAMENTEKAFGGSLVQENFRLDYGGDPNYDDIIIGEFMQTTYPKLTNRSIDSSGKVQGVDIMSTSELPKVLKLVQSNNVIVHVLYNNGIGQHMSTVNLMIYNTNNNSAIFGIMDPNGGLFRVMTSQETSSIRGFISIKKK